MKCCCGKLIKSINGDFECTQLIQFADLFAYSLVAHKEKLLDTIISMKCLENKIDVVLEQLNRELTTQNLWLEGYQSTVEWIARQSGLFNHLRVIFEYEK